VSNFTAGPRQPGLRRPRRRLLPLVRPFPISPSTTAPLPSATPSPPSRDLQVTHRATLSGAKGSIWTDDDAFAQPAGWRVVPGTWVDTPLPAPLRSPPAHAIASDSSRARAVFRRVDMPNTFPHGTIEQKL